MQAVLNGRDSLVVLPTGGGKSLCYQAPAVFRGDTTVVISPLISLMKDQVDGLRANGISAVQLNSAMSPDELREAERAACAGESRLVFASPERMATAGFRSLVKQIGVRTFAIDEAHCISHWGHDFRPEYRQLNRLKELFPQASVHAFTATATEQVRSDIVSQLALRDPEVLVGDFDRPNLTYRVLPRHDTLSQTCDLVRRHAGEAGIIYCIRRRDVDELTAVLRHEGVAALPYHAGLDAAARKRAQDAFSEETCDLIVATVAFGMGIDRSNVRYVLHTGMPKSIESYQQETGRAGRDGLEAECVLLYSGADAMLWKSIVEKSVGDAETQVAPDYLRNAMRHINDMDAFCRPVVCRHRALVQYFGQSYTAASCQACDLCLGDAAPVPDAHIIAKKILSCVARVREGFGVNHVVAVLRGENLVAIRDRGHDQLSTYGLLREHSKVDVRSWVQQLIGQNLLLQVGDEYPVLKLNLSSWEVMKDERTATLLHTPGSKPKAEVRAKKSKADAVSWEGVDRDLFEALRETRKRLAQERGVPPYLIFGDTTLRELAARRPATLERMHQLYGVGDAKLADFGPRMLETVARHCRERGVAFDCSPSESPQGQSRKSESPANDPERPPRPTSSAQVQAGILYEQGASIDDVMGAMKRSRGTAVEYLAAHIRAVRPASISSWISDVDYQQIAVVAEREGLERLKPIRTALGGRFDYDQIRIVVSHLLAQRGE